MAYVRNHGNQLAIVHGERDPETRKVRQRVLFKICSKPEARAALTRDSRGWDLQHMLQQRHPELRFDWDKIRLGIEQRMDALPDIYPYHAGEVQQRFRADLCAFTRQLGLADPQSMYSAAEVLNEHRHELEYIRDLIDWRLKVCDQQPNEWNGDNTFYWRHRLQPRGVPPEIIEEMPDLLARMDLDRLEALARLFMDCYDGYADGHNYLGLAAQARGELDEAVGHFRRAMTEGRKLFPKRLAKRHYWVDFDTRPYMRGLRNLAVALMRLGRHDEALDACGSLEGECGDTHAATTFRAHIYLNLGRWQDARKAAARVVGIWPEHAYITAFAALEQGERDDALRWFLHGLFTHPRTGQMLLGQRTSRPHGFDEVGDHNTGVETVANLEGFLMGLSRASRRFFKRILHAKTTQTVLDEAEEVAHRWHEEHRSGERDAFDRRQVLHSVEFATQMAEEVRVELMS